LALGLFLFLFFLEALNQLLLVVVLTLEMLLDLTELMHEAL